MNKIILIGIDGCDFRIIKPLIDQRSLPTLSHILKQGTHGTMISTKPPNSLPAWTSILTGVNPGKHGAIDFLVKTDNGFQLFSRNKNIRPIWKILDQHGLRQILVNEPITYPPEKINGVMLTGFSTPPKSKNFIYPKKLKNEINKVCEGYQAELDLQWKKQILSDKNGVFDTINKFTEKNYKAAIYLAKKYEWDLLSITFTSTDRLQHYFYNDIHLISSHYKILDDMLNNIINLDPEANLIIISDHGFGPLKKCFFINTWLKENNLMSIERDMMYKFLSKLNITYDKIISILLRLKLYELLAKIIPQSIKNKIPIYKEELKTDFKNSPAFINTINGGIYTNRNDVTQKIIDELKKCNIKGETPVQNIDIREDVWWGPYAKNAPNVIVTPQYGYEISPRNTTSILEKPEKVGDIRTGTHRPEGIFIAYGPSIKNNCKLDEPVLTWDIAPTVLHMMNIPTPDYMDGKVLKTIFK